MWIGQEISIERKDKLEAIIRAFDRIGSRAIVTDVAPPTEFEIWRAHRQGDRVPERFITVDVGRDKRGEFFHIGVDASVDLHVMNLEKALKHLLLFAVDGEGRKYRYLCGHDERHWFAAAIAEGVSTVEGAIESLKPDMVAEAQAGLKRKDRIRRKNAATLRQGEWFFIPVPDLKVDPGCILRDEPIRRGNGSPHIVQELFRHGGETVFRCGEYPDGVPEDEYERLIAEEPKRRFWGWTSMVRNMEVYGRGRITHRDHATITLNGWHRILANTESEAWFMVQTLVFLD
jgi:hypothetical protein